MKLLTSLAIVFATVASCHGQTAQPQQAEVSASAQKTKSTLTENDQLQIAVQAICPVSGGELGSMGEPIKVKVGEQIAYLCCRGCQEKQLNKDHWATIQDRLAAAQGICPIMEQPVDATMKSTVVNSQQVFVCCPPCMPKIQADAEGSLTKVNAYYASFIAKERQAASDKIHASAQAICPVTGRELGSMGEPVKVKVGKAEVAFLCCKGCVGKQIKAEHWKTIQTNLATAQKICPVMEEAVDASMTSTVVNGRKIFVCCPPCIKKIQADPAGHVAKLDALIVGNTVEDADRKQGN